MPVMIEPPIIIPMAPMTSSPSWIHMTVAFEPSEYSALIVVVPFIQP